MQEATFRVRIFQNDEGRWWAEVYQDRGMTQSWDSGEWECPEHAIESACVIIGEAFGTAFGYTDHETRIGCADAERMAAATLACRGIPLEELKQMARPERISPNSWVLRAMPRITSGHEPLSGA